jgi:hypothetical protein
MCRFPGLRRARLLSAVLAVVAVLAPGQARAATYTMTINLYDGVLGVRARDEGSNQPYPFTLSGCIGTLYKDGTKVSPATDWNVVGTNNFTESISFAPIDSRKDVVSVDTINNVAFTLYGSGIAGKQGWFGLWSPFGNGPSSTKTYSDFDTNVHWVTDNGAQQYREMAPSIASSQLNGAALGNIQFKFPGDIFSTSAAVTMTISSNQFGKYWGAFEVTSNKFQAGLEPAPGEDGTNFVTTDEFDQARDPDTGFAFAVPLPSTSLGVVFLLSTLCLTGRRQRAMTATRPGSRS